MRYAKTWICTISFVCLFYLIRWALDSILGQFVGEKQIKIFSTVKIDVFFEVLYLILILLLGIVWLQIVIRQLRPYLKDYIDSHKLDNK